MKARLDGYYSPHLEDLRHAVLGDDFCYLLRLNVGADDGPGADTFDLRVCTPKWLERELGSDGYVLGEHMVIVSRHDFDPLILAIRGYIESQEADS